MLLTALRAGPSRLPRLPVPTRHVVVRRGIVIPPTLTIVGQTYPTDAHTNVPPAILSKTGRDLHLSAAHPLGTLKTMIEAHFSTFAPINPASPVVTVAQNFDELGFPPDHPGRAATDSYYVNGTHMLRTHTSAHEVEAYATGGDRFLICADVYRRDEIDRSHYPVFHQMEGMCLFSDADELARLPARNAALAQQLEACPLVIDDTSSAGSHVNPYQPAHEAEIAAHMAQNLKHNLNALIFRLFGGQTQDGEPLRVRWIDASFPWTSPSFEVEVWWNGEWLEILGCGVVAQEALARGGVPEKCGWAFGLGLERIAMILFSIPDIRLFWTSDTRFLSQFAAGEIATFRPYSKYPPCYKDMSFWLPASAAPAAGAAGAVSVKVDVEAGAKAAGGAEEGGEGKATVKWHENDYCEIVRDVAGDLVENVALIDEFTHPKTGRKSLCYRLNYRSMDRSLSNEEVNALQDQVQRRVVDEMGIEMR
ncbi:phenylalanyl-tRNA synthetase alpha subunit, mitochondrial [Cryptotrichosporon argae]